ncbi:MAG TPA: thioredoxin domain-containing protein [Solirubrobacteraceae bacterium]|nr:thioredoxin domain-containing protein [Solirubrobacteraceae bacterium]
MANVLAYETSPYLRQHASNPVDWMPWGPAALERAHTEDRPLLVSIGYSSCHWCHVMERESFEDERTAALMNESFVCVKVDREERPDIDALYMEAVQSMTGHGGWPLNVFLTPELDPFYGGTYYPPQERHGMPSWTGVLQAIAEAWDQSRDDIRRTGARLREHLGASARMSPSNEPITQTALDGALARLSQSFDTINGGFGGAPKFPPASVIDFLLLRSERTITLTTLRGMARGGIHDQLGGGFARYSVDASWTVPHFEKMLYDNALLARAYLHGWQASGDRYLLDVCIEALRWALREMRGPEGGFYSALDADSEGAEGRYYTWTIEQIVQALASERDASAAIAWFGATPEGNFVDPHDPRPGVNVLQARGPRPDEQTAKRVRARLLEQRSQRERPGLDDKRLTSWNALMITALAEAATALAAHTPAGVERDTAQTLLDAAIACAEFILAELRDEHGRLLRAYNDGQAKIAAYLEDHAFLLEAMIALFESNCDERWLEHARALADETVERFADSEQGGFFSTAADAEELIVRRKELEDTPIPSGSSSAALGLLRLSQLTGEDAYERHAVSVLRLEHEIAVRHPAAFGALLQAMHHYLAPARPVACLLPSGARAGATSQGAR